MKVMAITAVAGNAKLPDVVRNTYRMLEITGTEDVSRQCYYW